MLVGNVICSYNFFLISLNNPPAIRDTLVFGTVYETILRTYIVCICVITASLYNFKKVE